MALTQLIVHAVVQAVTEVFPIGGAGHQALISQFLDNPPPDKALSLTLRAALLLAVLTYFWRDLLDMAGGVMRAAKGKRDPGARLAAQIFAAGVAATALFLGIERYAAGFADSREWIGWLGVGGALALLAFDTMCMTVKRVEHATFIDAVLIGLGEAVALLPALRACWATSATKRCASPSLPERCRWRRCW